MSAKRPDADVAGAYGDGVPLTAEDSQMFRAPRPGQPVRVRLTRQMVRALRAHHEDAPAATNHELGDQVAALLDAGVRNVTGVCAKSSGRRVGDGRGETHAIAADELVWLRCVQLTGDPQQLVMFCARDCDLPALPRT